ncbi:MAG: hypothetical protein M5U28_36110 [Sandaracinaceae bacterium]|nr:hypothetical protein [Sandaracinaceae bacterium]
MKPTRRTHPSPVPLARPNATKKPAQPLPVAAQILLLTQQVAALEAQLAARGASSPAAPTAPPESVQRLERDLRAAGVSDPKRLAAARQRATTLSASAKPARVPPLNEADPRVVSLRRMLSQASLPERAIAGAIKKHWARLHGA